jgi:hypothetical protein
VPVGGAQTGTPPAQAEHQLCAEPTPLSLLSMDTAAGRILLSLPDAAAGGSRPVELTADEGSATLFPAVAVGERFAGSIGPGPRFALSGCGEGCVQALRWQDGRWRPLGAPLRVPPTAIFHTTYDRAGGAWITVHGLAGERGLTDVTAYRFQDGRWTPAGRLTVHAVGTPAAAPAPWRDDAIVSGSGQFAVGQAPAYWAGGLPPGEGVNEGNLVALTQTAATFLGRDGDLLYSVDRGKSWIVDRWRPWGVEKTQIWSYGSDYGVDLPQGSVAGALPVLWFDQRSTRRHALHLTELTDGGHWRLIAESDPRLEASFDEPLEITTFLHTAAGRWLLLSDCHRQGGRAGFLLRTAPPLGLSPARFVPILEP